MSFDEFFAECALHSDHGVQIREIIPAIQESLANTPAECPALEIGNREGGSTALIMWHLANEAKGRRMVTVDTNTGMPVFMTETASRFGIVNDYHPNTTQETFVVETQEKFGFIFLDADHNYHFCKRDIEVLSKKVAKGCVIVVDDVKGWPELPDMTGVGLERVEYSDLPEASLGHIAFYKKT